AGLTVAVNIRLGAPESFAWVESFIILCIVVVGGMGNIAGVTLGAAAMIVVPELLRGLSLYRMFVFGGGLVPMTLFRPQGLLPGTMRRRAAAPGSVAVEGDPA